MEHVAGQDLQSKVDSDGVLEVAPATDYIRQAADAMQYAHAAGVKHLDLKPANLMVDSQGVVKILDIGVGHLRQPTNSPDANTGELMVSAISYMAPEQARDAEVDERADIYSLGGTLYFLLTGRAPFAAQNDEERAKLKESKQPLPIEDLRSNAPAALSAVCNKAMALKPENRYASMAELLEAIGDCQNGAAEAVAEVDAAELETKEKEPASTESTKREAGQAQAETAEAEAAEKAKAEPEAEKIEIAAKPKPEAGGFSIDTGDGGKTPTGGIGGFNINTKRRKKRKPDAKSAPAPEPEPAELAEPAADAEEPAPTAEKTKPATKAKPAAQAKPVEKAKPAAKGKPVTPADETAEPLATAEVEELEPEELEAEELEAQAEPVERKKGPPLVLIIGGACAAAVLLLATGLVAGMFLFGRGPSTAVAQAPVAQPPAPEGEAPDSESDAVDSETGPDATATPASGDPTEGAVGSEGAADATSEAVGNDTQAAAVPDASAVAEPGAAEPATTDVVAQPGVPEGESGNADVATPGPAADQSATPPASASTEPKPAAEPAEMKKPATEDPEKKKAEENPPEKKKAPPKKKAAPKKKAPPPKAFIPTSDSETKKPVVPPPPTERGEVVLGKVNAGPQELVFLSLSGGDTAFNSRTEFTLENAQDGVAPRDWEFFVTEGSGDPVVIATLSLPEKELKFKWAEAAATNVAAGNLRNCSLTVTAGQGEPVQVALRHPTLIPGMAIDLDKSSGAAKWPIDGAPDRSSLRMEVTVKGHKATVDPSQMSLGKGDSAYVYFAPNRDAAALLLKVTASASAKFVQVKVEPQFLLPGQNPQRLTKATLRQLPQLAQKQGVMQTQFIEMEKEANKPQNRQRMQNVIAGARQQLDAINKAVARLQQLKTEMAAVNGTGSLQFRVFAETFDKPIDLLLPDLNAEPRAP